MLLIYLCEYSYFVSMHFLFSGQKHRLLSILLHSIVLFSVFWNIYQKYLSAKYVSKYVKLCEFTQLTLFLNFNTKHMATVVSFRFSFSLWSCSSDLPSSYFFLSQQFWSMFYHGSVGRVQNKMQNTLIYFRYFLAVFVVFYKIFVFNTMYALNAAYFLWAGNAN